MQRGRHPFSHDVVHSAVLSMQRKVCFSALSWETTYCGLERFLFMFWIIGIVLLILWAGGFFVFHVAGFLIHILIILAVISFIVGLVQGR